MPQFNNEDPEDFEREYYMDDEFVEMNMNGANFGFNLFNMEAEEMAYDNAEAFDEEVD